MSHFQIGWAEYSLTPDKKVSLVGQFAERISEYVEKPLCVTAMAVSTDSDQAVFCSCDLVGVSWSLRDAVREKLAGNTVGLDPNKRKKQGGHWAVLLFDSLLTWSAQRYPARS